MLYRTSWEINDFCQQGGYKVPSDHQDESLHTTVTSQERSKIRCLAEEALQMRLLNLFARCKWEEVSDSISALSDQEVIELSHLIQKLLVLCPSWNSLMPDAKSSKVQDTAEGQ